MEIESSIKDPTLQTFIAESKARLNAILKRLDWDRKKIGLTDQVQNNPLPTDNLLPSDKEPEFPPSCATNNSVATDLDELRKIVEDDDKEIPNKFSDLQLNFTRDQKLAIYEHVVANTVKLTEPETNVPVLGENALTFAQIVAQKKRESKNRRRHRRSKPTHTEEVRAVVDLHMQALQQYLNAKTDKHTNDAPICKRRRLEADRNINQKESFTPAKVYSNHRRKSKSPERKIFKTQRHRSRSSSRSYKQKVHHHNRDRSRSNEKGQHKYRISSRSKDTSRSYSRNHRSRSPKRQHTKRRSRSRKRNDSERDATAKQSHRRRSRSHCRRSRSPNRKHYRRSRSRSHNRKHYEKH